MLEMLAGPPDLSTNDLIFALAGLAFSAFVVWLMFREGK